MLVYHLLFYLFPTSFCHSLILNVPRQLTDECAAVSTHVATTSGPVYGSGHKIMWLSLHILAGI